MREDVQKVLAPWRTAPSPHPERRYPKRRRLCRCCRCRRCCGRRCCRSRRHHRRCSRLGFGQTRLRHRPSCCCCYRRCSPGSCRWETKQRLHDHKRGSLPLDDHGPLARAGPTWARRGSCWESGRWETAHNTSNRQRLRSVPWADQSRRLACKFPKRRHPKGRHPNPKPGTATGIRKRRRVHFTCAGTSQGPACTNRCKKRRERTGTCGGGVNQGAACTPGLMRRK
jgi:hypothetical protein